MCGRGAAATMHGPMAGTPQGRRPFSLEATIRLKYQPILLAICFSESPISLMMLEKTEAVTVYREISY